MGRKRSARKTANRTSEERSGQSEIEARLEHQGHLVEQLTQQLNDANQRLAQHKTESARPTTTDSARVLECLTTLLSAHEDLQPKRTLQRIEDKIDDLRERESSSRATERPESTDHRKDWSCDEIPTNVMSDVEPPGHEAPDESVEEETPSLSGLLAPDPIDVDQADVEALRTAVEQRDSYAVCLLHQIRVVERRKLITADELSQIENVSDERKAAVAELEARLEEVLRLTEVELSMERARISRESVRIQHQQSLLSQQEARLNEQRDSMNIAPPSPEKSNRKWLAELGFGKD